MARARYAKNPEARRKGNRESSYRQRYGITLEQKNQMLAMQGGVCAICKTDSPPTATGWHVDHCHNSRVVRGILCQQCNNMLGNAKDSPEILIQAASYLKGQ